MKCPRRLETRKMADMDWKMGKEANQDFDVANKKVTKVKNDSEDRPKVN